MRRALIWVCNVEKRGRCTVPAPHRATLPEFDRLSHWRHSSSPATRAGLARSGYFPNGYPIWVEPVRESSASDLLTPRAASNSAPTTMAHARRKRSFHRYWGDTHLHILAGPVWVALACANSLRNGLVDQLCRLQCRMSEVRQSQEAITCLQFENRMRCALGRYDESSTVRGRSALGDSCCPVSIPCLCAIAIRICLRKSQRSC